MPCDQGLYGCDRWATPPGRRASGADASAALVRGPIPSLECAPSRGHHYEISAIMLEGPWRT